MEVWNNQLLLAEGNWDDINKAARSVRSQVVHRLISHRAIPCERGIAYWTAVPASQASTALFYVQHAPVWIARGLVNAYASRKSISLSQLASEHLGPHWTALRSLGLTHSGLRPYIVGRYRALTALWSHWAKSICAERQKKLEAERDAAAEQIGQLLMITGTDSSSTSPADFVAQLAHTMLNKSSRPESPEEALEILQDVLDHQPSKLASQIPAFATRWWPLAAMTLLAAWKLNGSWTLLADWLENSVVGTVRAFYENWIVSPLLKIYKTVRHDPTEKVALVAKESLASDTTSLERMVVDFARDTDPSLSASDLEALRVKAANGDLTPVMAVYEKQIGSPVTSLVTGKLVRTLLIQVQKSKVDLEVALSGIDQLLQSQQLVFGLVAAIPAIGVLWWLTKVAAAQLYRQLYGTEAANAKSERADVISALGNLDFVVQRAPTTMRDVDIGLVFMHVAMIRQVLKSKTLESQQLHKVLDRLLDDAIGRSSTAVLADLDRAYLRYQLR